MSLSSPSVVTCLLQLLLISRSQLFLGKRLALGELSRTQYSASALARPSTVHFVSYSRGLCPSMSMDNCCRAPREHRNDGSPFGWLVSMLKTLACAQCSNLFSDASRGFDSSMIPDEELLPI